MNYKRINGGQKGGVMKTLILVLILAGISFGAYKLFIAESPAYQTFQKFAETMTRGRTEEALKFAKDESVMSDAGDAEHNVEAGYVPVQYIHGTNYQLESEEKTADGNLRLKVKQIVCFDSPGATNAIGGAMAAILDKRL
jgi:hypothetical protein